MSEQLTKLRPDRDLQCYFQQPSSVAALSGATATGFSVSGCWRQQFDWAVVEWNRDSVFEHPSLRKLPDGDLSGMRLTYDEARNNCMPIDSTMYDSSGWSYLRIWEESGGTENFHRVPLRNYASPVSGDYAQATAVFELQGVATAGDSIELAWLDQHYNYQIAPGDTLPTAAMALAGFINGNSATSGVTASVTAASITLTFAGAPGANGNRFGAYGTAHRDGGTPSVSWAPWWENFSGGASPALWRVSLDFSDLIDDNNQRVPTQNVRKLRWTWAADLQFRAFEREEFSVAVTNWQVTGTNLNYNVAGSGSRRIENNSAEVTYTGPWAEERGNFSAGAIQHTASSGARVACSYTAAAAHQLYLGTRYLNTGSVISVQVDSNPIRTMDLRRPAEDVLVRLNLGEFGGPAQHVITITHIGDEGADVYFDFLEIALPTADLPTFGDLPKLTLATDWDTDHSLALPAERTAWLINKLGFKGRANHYAGAMWWYELECRENQYASATVTFIGTPIFGGKTTVSIADDVLEHLNLIGDSAESIAKCFELSINTGSSSVWAQADGPALTITSRLAGAQGNTISIAASPDDGSFSAVVSSATLAGGVDGKWLTDLEAAPRMNRAARDWNRSFFEALHSYGIDAAAAFSMELRHGDDSLSAGIAQRYPDGPVWLSTPALQTNFSPASLNFWRQVYADMASIMAETGVRPYLQFGEVQWWYFADASGMPFYDEHTQSAFQSMYGRPMALIPSENADPSLFPDECSFLEAAIGEFTAAIMQYVRQQIPNTRFEVLFPPDTNDTALNRIINFPSNHWTAENLDCLKTENFTFTGNRDLNKARTSISLPAHCGFPAAQSGHLIGIGEPTTPWQKERRLAEGAGLESVVLFALDQFCLVGYSLPLDRGRGRSRFMGAQA